MPLYEYRKNAENLVPLNGSLRPQVKIGLSGVMDEIVRVAVEARKKGPGGVTLAWDGWYGVKTAALVAEFERRAREVGLTVRAIHARTMLKDAEAIDRYRRPYVSEDPAFGVVNTDGVLEDLIEPSRRDRLQATLKAQQSKAGDTDVILVYGPGAAIKALEDSYTARFYFDFTMQPMLWQMWGGELVPLGREEPAPDYSWKMYYYCDFYLLYRHKIHALQKMDYYVDAVDASNPKLMPRAPYEAMIASLVKQPIKQVKIMQPGPWGAYRYRDLWEVPGLECNAWNELAGIELSILIDVGAGDLINVPAQNIMQHPVQMVGEKVHREFPGLLPLQVWLDDGYFPQPVPFERSSMPIHDHPDTEYVRRHFKEPLGRYETYYIVEAYPGATTWMGYREDADLEEWERRCRESDRTKQPIANWQEFIKRWDTNVGDLFLIPPGTTHGHGGNQMILEMDTCPSVCGTEYSFFTYDFCRQTWDDTAKTMTGKPMRMHVDHSFRNNRWRRENYVREKLRSRPVVRQWTRDFRQDQYTSLPEMPFHIERLVFEQRAEGDTEGRFLQILTLAEGKRVKIRPKHDPTREVIVERLQAVLIPAGIGPYEVINLHEGACAAVIIRLKDA